MTDEFGEFPDRRRFAVGAFGATAYVEACAAYTARVALATYRLLDARLPKPEPKP